MREDPSPPTTAPAAPTETTPPAGPAGIAAARETVRRLAWPEGCAWHGVQTHASLVPFLIEETAEFIDAVERGLPAEEVAGELGDVLYQVLFHAAIAERDGEGYDLDTVAAGLDRKLIDRHPHVFGDRGYMSVDELHAEWERLKEDAAGEARGSRGALDGIPAGMPTLARAAKVVERLKRAGLIDPAADAPPPSSQALPPSPWAQSQDLSDDEAHLGDAILRLVIQANARGLDADRALRDATRRFAERLAPEG